jgi:hypothetical protein
MNLAAAYFVESIVAFIPAYFGLRKYMRKEDADLPMRLSFARWQVWGSFLAFFVSLGLGSLIASNAPLNVLLLPIFTLAVILIPIWFLFGVGANRLPLGTRWRFWSIFGLGMTLSPFVLIILEILLGIAVLALLIVYVIVNPDLVEKMTRLASQMEGLSDPEQILGLVAPYLSNPKILLIALGYIALAVPLLEELIKPIGVWLFGRQITTSAEGFAMGALSGSAYAFIESLGVAAVSGVDWASLVSARAGTSLLHILTSGLMGSAIVQAFHGRKYLRLLLTYLGAVLLHGIWNGMTVTIAFSTVATWSGLPSDLSRLSVPAIGAMFTLVLGLLASLILFNRRMRATFIPPASEIPVEAIEEETPANG